MHQLVSVVSVVSVCASDDEAVSASDEAIRHPRYVYSPPVISHPGSLSLPPLFLSHLEQREFSSRPFSPFLSSLCLIWQANLQTVPEDNNLVWQSINRE